MDLDDMTVAGAHNGDFEPDSTRLLFANPGSVNVVDVGEAGLPLQYPTL